MCVRVLFIFFFSSLSSFCFHVCCFFFFNDTATTEIYTLSLHDALPICSSVKDMLRADGYPVYLEKSTGTLPGKGIVVGEDRKSTRLNSSHTVISYAVFCLKKKKKKKKKQDSSKQNKNHHKTKNNLHTRD